MFSKIHIIGSPGSGKTYAAEQMARRLNIPAYQLDKFFWNADVDDYAVRCPAEVRDKQLDEVLQNHRWIIEGAYYDWLYDTFAQADRILVLQPNRFLRDWRLLKRFTQGKLGFTKGSTKFLIKLIQWNHEYDNYHLPRALQLITEFEHKTDYFDSADKAISYIIDSA